jgi:M3 family oligoendopeptidase
MKFTEFHYERPDIDALSATMKDALERFAKAEDFESCSNLLKEIYKIRNGFETMREIASIRHTINTKDEFYETEQDYFDNNQPIYEGLVSEFYQALLSNPHRDKLEEHFGKQLFSIAKMAINTFSEDIIEDLRKENELGTAYRKIKAAASIPFRGEEKTLPQMMALLRSSDRDVRKEAYSGLWGYMSQYQEQFDQIYHDLVQVRTRIAHKLGYDNFVGLAYDRLQRSDYNAENVAVYRKQILDEVVPFATELRERQRERLGLETLYHYDEEFTFRSGNPTPQGDPNWIIEQGKTMYEDLSAKTGEFYNYMLDGELLDLVSKKGKAPGGYCTFIHNNKSPFIFSNFNGTAMDIFVLTHEAGHAFQVYMSRDYLLNEYNWPTLEACEIHSMSMEFFTWPWMDLFFGDDAEKFRYMHVLKSLTFLPYGVAVDEFQHHVYENPEETPDQRAAAWKEIESKYLPFRKYDDFEFLDGGRLWQMQSHIFESPFYYIDYTLAQVCAYQFWQKDLVDSESAFADYVRLCEAGGSRPFLELVDYAGLESPFEPGTVNHIMKDIRKWLSGVDDRSLEKADAVSA